MIASSIEQTGTSCSLDGRALNSASLSALLRERAAEQTEQTELETEK